MSDSIVGSGRREDRGERRDSNERSRSRSSPTTILPLLLPLSGIWLRHSSSGDINCRSQGWALPDIPTGLADFSHAPASSLLGKNREAEFPYIARSFQRARSQHWQHRRYQRPRRTPALVRVASKAAVVAMAAGTSGAGLRGCHRESLAARKLFVLQSAEAITGQRSRISTGANTTGLRIVGRIPGLPHYPR